MADGHTLVYDVVQQLAEPEDAILDRYRIDVVDVGRTFDASKSGDPVTTETLQKQIMNADDYAAAQAALAAKTAGAAKPQPGSENGKHS